jgi:CubicO group peptidase (beta-lactamase class C family)
MKVIANYRDKYLKQAFRTIDVPHDLDSVMDTDTEAEVASATVGLSEDAVNNIWQACEDLYRSSVYPMMGFCLRHRGEIVLNRTLGESRPGITAALDTPVGLHSASKAVSAVLIHLLAEQGHVNLLNPVSYYIPAFAAQGKGSITLQQLLSHSGGVPNVPEDTDIELLFDHDASLKMICAAAPTNHQSRDQAYHAVTSGFLFNELIKITTGLDAQQYLDRYIRKPMGMRYFRFGLTKREQAKVAHNSITGMDIKLINNALTGVLGADPDTVIAATNDARFFNAVIPSVNLYATAEELSRFYQMLLNHGEWQGKRILDPLTVHRATRPLDKTELDRTLMLPMRYSAGMMLGGSPVGMYGKDTQYAYGHLGYSNILGWADPERDITVGLVNSGKPVIGPHMKALPGFITKLSAACEPFVDMATDEPAYQRKPKPHSKSTPHKEHTYKRISARKRTPNRKTH